MVVNDSGIGRTEAIGATTVPPMSGVTPEPSMAALPSQLEQLTAVISELTTRMDGPDLRLGDTSTLIRLSAGPPFSRPYSTQSTDTMPIFTYTPTPSVGPHIGDTSLTPFSSGFLQTLGTSPTTTFPQFRFTDAGSAVTTTVRVSQHHRNLGCRTNLLAG